MRDAIKKRKIKRNKKRNSTDAIIIKNINSVPLKINKNRQNPLSALEAVLLVQIATKTCL